MSQSTQQHREEAAKRSAIVCAVLTVSDSRTSETDHGGDLVEQHLREAGHTIAMREIIRDETEVIRAALINITQRKEIQAVILTGGTGIAPRDVTPEALGKLLTRRLDGFGELFRMLSWEQIGAAAMLSRAVGGLIGPLVTLAIPGSTAAVRLAMERLIIPELRHLVDQANR